jgi:hypothetical protein
MTDLAAEIQEIREELDQLKSREEIRQQLTRYGRGQEWLDETLLAEVFWEDADIDFGFFEGKFKEYLPVLMEIERDPETTFHLLASAQIELDGDTAYVECYGIAGGRGTDKTNIFGGRYIERFERREGPSGKEWRIASCTYVLDWNMDQDVPDVVGGPHPELKMIKPRSPDHPWFRRMGRDVT